MSQKVVTPNPCRLSYPALFRPKTNQEGRESYAATLLIPKSDTQTVQLIQQAIQAEAQAAGAPRGKWGKPIAQPKTTFYDGDGVTPNGMPWPEECHGCYVLRTSSPNPPDVVDEYKMKAMDATKFYAGCWCYFSINISAYNTAGSMGIGAYLNCVMFARDDEPLDGHASAAEDFANITAAQPAAQAAPAEPIAYTPAYGGVNPWGK